MLQVASIIFERESYFTFQLRPDKLNEGGRIGTFGGKIEDGESPPQAAIREIIEETDKIPSSDDLEYLGAVEVVSNGRDVSIEFFLCQLENKVIAKEGAAIEIEKSKLSDPEHDFTPGTKAAINQLLKGA